MSSGLRFKRIIRLQQCNNKTSVPEFGSANLSLNSWRQSNDTSLVSCFYQQLRSSPILYLFKTEIKSINTLFFLRSSAHQSLIYLCQEIVFISSLLNSFKRRSIKIMVHKEFIKYTSRRRLHTWYSLISDLSKPGMKSVTDFLLISNLTDDVILLV